MRTASSAGTRRLVKASSMARDTPTRCGSHQVVPLSGASPIAVNAEVREALWAMTLMSLAGRGVKVAAVLLEAETWGAEQSSLDVYGTLAAGGIYTYTVKRSDDLARALGGRGEVLAAESAP